jgi:RNA recognition motif-containing protein
VFVAKILTWFRSVNIDISIDPFTACNPSYCFVDLVSAEAATSAMHNLNGEEFFGRPLKIKPCIQKRDSPQRVQAEGVIFDRWNHGPSRGSESRDHLRQPSVEGRRLYVGGLSKPLDTLTSDTELRELFKDFKVVGVSKVKSPRENHRPGNHFYAFVDLESNEEAEEAAKRLNGTMAFGQRLKVNLATLGSGRDLFESAKREKTTRYGNRNQENSVDLPY